MITVPSILDLDLSQKRVIIREDFNVPIVQNRITNDRRIQASLHTIEYALSQKAAVILLSHLGRPPLNALSDEFSLAPIAHTLSRHLQQPVRFVKDWINGITIQPGEVVLCENVRLHPKEMANDAALAQQIADLGDVFVMDAFAVAHRTEASTVGAIQKSKQVCQGLLFLSEIENLMPFENPKRPFMAVMGGSKTTTKLKEIKNWVQHVDALLLGGELANIFLKAKTHLNNNTHFSTSSEMDEHVLQLLKEYPSKIHLPSDGIARKTNEAGQVTFTTKPVNELSSEEVICDIGTQTIHQYTEILKDAETIFWNGPMGIFENPNFENGTRKIAEAISESKALSIAGGGETLAAIDTWQFYPSVVSTGGGALLDYLAGKKLPVIEALKERSTS